MAGNNIGKRNLEKFHRKKRIGKSGKSAAVFLDRDGTIIEELGYLADHNKVFILPEVIPALRLLKKLGFKLILATNQSGIGRKYFSHEQLKKIHDRLAGIFAINDVRLDEIYYCPHHPDDKCLCRKPCPEIAFRAKRKLNLDLAASYAVGDKISDVQFARNFGGRGILVLTGHGAKQEFSPRPDFVAKDMMDAAKWIASNTDNIRFRPAVAELRPKILKER